MPTLADFEQNARSELFDVIKVFKPTCGLKERIRLYRLFCGSLQVIAYNKLLAECDVGGFFLNLARIAANWKQLLVHVNGPGETYRLPASMNIGLLCALVCGRLPLALEIAELSARVPTPPEYDDEFYAAYFLQEYLRGKVGAKPGTASLEDICDRVDTYLEQPTPRIETLRALARADARAFGSSFRQWNEEAARELVHRAEGPGAPYHLGITRYIWLEGLAVLRLAERVGLEHGNEGFRLIPVLVRAAPGPLPDPTSFLLGQPLTRADLEP